MAVHTLNVGESLIMKEGFFNTGEHLVYAGMPTDSCFSIVVTWSIRHNSAAHNLFFPVTQQQIEFSGRRFAVKEVSQARVQLEEID